ncbi:MAG: ABC transporter substrate-binding protein [Campylobacteraceae bacterium]|jgi:branched-chain amino acid transport system substrate-binding protein|nr:ABC transporter substrate-binding protein [Campylobacteraceae bacterium]
MKKASSLAVSIALLSSLAVAKEIKIGAVMPMSGAIASYGQTAYEGVKLANEMQPTLKNGDTIKVILVDNKGDKVETSTATSRLINSEGVIGILGALTSTNTAQVISIAEKSKIPVVAPAATNDQLTTKKEFANRVCFMDSFQGEVVANYAFNDLGLKNASLVIDQAQVYSIGLAKAFEQTFKANGGKIVKKITVSSGDKDYKAAVSQIKSANPDFIFLPVYHPEASMFARQAKQAGLDVPMFSGDGVSTPTFVELGGSAVEGYMFTDFFDPEFPPTEKSKEFINEYKKSTGKSDIASFTALGADTYFLLVDAMNRCEDPTDSVCVNKEIKATRNFEGVSGVLNLNEKGDAIRSAVIKEIKDGKPVYKATVNP